MARVLRTPSCPRRATAPRDTGAAMAMAVIVAAVVFALGGVLLAFASHEDSASNNDRRRQQAVDAAIAGLVVADSALTRNSAYAASGLVAFAGGDAEFEVTVTKDPTAASTFGRIITSTGYAPSKAAALKTVRTMRQVVELVPVGFTYAVFSETNIVTGSSASASGDIYSNGSISFGNSQDYIGDVYAQGSITTGSNQNLTGTLYSNGNVSVSSSSTQVYGSVYAGGNITTGGTIRDTAQAGGTIGCTKVLGACIPNSPPPLVPVQHLPEYVWNPSNYPSVTTYTSGAQFVADHSKTDSAGVFYITGSVSFAKQDSLWLTDDVTIVATGAITLPGTIVNHAPGAAKVQLTVISTGGGTITPSNNFTIPATVTTLMYTAGAFDAKNSSTFTGALYAGNVSSGAHIAVSHELLKTPGFDWSDAGPRLFTIRNVSTREMSTPEA